jgi:hypothetical protein
LAATIWSFIVSRHLSRATRLETDKYAPELFVIGSDGGVEAIAFDRRDENGAVVMVPFLPLDVKEAKTGPAL